MCECDIYYIGPLTTYNMKGIADNRHVSLVILKSIILSRGKICIGI